MKCPHCGRDLDSVEGQKFCSFCGGTLEEPPESPSNAQQKKRGDDEEIRMVLDPYAGPRGDYCPWEDQENLGFATGVYDTVRQTLFDSKAFFARMPVDRGFLLPLLYALIVQTLGVMVGFLWALSSDSPLVGPEALPQDKLLIVGILIPPMVFLGVVTWAAVLHGSLFLVGGVKERFEATFRVACYSSTPELFNAVPVIGGFVALGWKFYITVIGLREVHNISTGRALGATLLPSVVCCAVGIFAFSTALTWSGTSLTP